MSVIVEVAIYTMFFYCVTFFMGIGLTRIALTEHKLLQMFLAPWVGIVQTGMVLTFLGFFDIGTDRSCWAAVAIGTLLLIHSMLKHFTKEYYSKIRQCSLIMTLTILVILVLMTPVIRKSEHLNSFTSGNNDVWDYVFSAQLLKEGGLSPFILGYQQVKGHNIYEPAFAEKVKRWNRPEGEKIKSLYAFLGYLPRWLPVYYLSFLSSISGQTPESIFSLSTILLYVLFLPLIWLFGRWTLNMDKEAAWMGITLALLNPHILYVVYHGFMSQVMGMGFFLCFLILFPSFIETSDIQTGITFVLLLFVSGLLMSYTQLMPFWAIAVMFYSGWLYGTGKIPWPTLVSRFGLLMIGLLIACPYHVYRLFPLLWSELTQSAARGGWQVTDGFYLFAFQMGGFFSAASAGTMNPSKLLEWILNPVVLFLIVYAFRKLERGVFVLSILLPFLISGLLAYLGNRNYAYFKNFTIVYYLIPILLGQGIYQILEWVKINGDINGPYKKILRWTCIFLVILIGVLSGVKAAERIVLTTRHGLFVPQELNRLKEASQHSEIRELYINGLTQWEVLWVKYFLRDPKITMPYYNNLLDNSVDSVSNPRFSFLLIHNRKNKLFDQFENREIEKIISQSPQYTLCQLRKNSERNSMFVTIGPGFFEPEGNENEAWVWAGKECQLYIDTQEKDTESRLELEIVPLRDQSVQFTLNDKKIQNPVPLDDKIYNVCKIPLKLKRGRNILFLKSNLESIDNVTGDPRALNLRFIRIRLI